MNFQNIAKIEKADWYLDLAFRKSREMAEFLKKELQGKKSKGKSRGGDRGGDRDKRLKQLKEIEKRRIDTVSDVLCHRLLKVQASFPDMSQMSPFYLELIKITLDFGTLKKSLGAIKWVTGKIHEHSRETKGKIYRAAIEAKLSQHRVAYYGRISSFVKQIKNELNYLDEARKVLKGFPDIKDDIKTVVITGFPNVGKTTLLSKLTTSKPDIQSYPFTTKSINLGYGTIGQGKDEQQIQYIDTPGVLNRNEKMNYIEKLAHVCEKYLADVVVYVFDLTEQYPLEEQIKLIAGIYNRKQLTYFSKFDLIGDKKIDEFCKKNNYKKISDIGSLKKEIEQMLKK